jgi:putative membrane protein
MKPLERSRQSSRRPVVSILRQRCPTRWIYLVLLLAIVATLVVFVFQNRENVTIIIFNHEITAPMSLIFVAVYFLGMWSGGTVVGFFKRTYHHAIDRDGEKRPSS